MSTVSRKTKWHPTLPPPPSPQILHLPRRRRTHRRKQTKRPTNPNNDPLLLMNPKYDPSSNDDLQNLFYQESHTLQPDLLNLPSEGRQRVEEREEEDQEKWRFQAEMLRAECNLLRMEREHALKKLEKKRVKMETTLRSAVQTLVSGRKKIEDGKVLEEEIEDLEEKIEELQKSVKDSEVGKYNNFQKKAWLLQRGLEKVGVGVLSNEKELQKVADSMTSNFAHKSDYHKASRKEEKCSGRCKAMVLRIMEQVRAETEQWSQMQNMLDKVRGEMEEMQTSRDYWELQARNSDHQIQSLTHAVEEWKERALDYEKQVKALQLKLSSIKQKKKTMTRKDEGDVVPDLPLLPLGEQLVKERLALKENKKTKAEKELLPPLSLAKQIAKEKRSLNRGLKENMGNKQELPENGRGVNRSPLRNIANSSLLERQSHRIAFDCRSPESSRIRESFRK